MRVDFSDKAETDLEAIGDYIAIDSPRRALSFVAELRARCLALSDFPRAYPILDRSYSTQVRRAVHGSYLIIYAVSPDVVEIVRVIHSARDYEAEIGLTDSDPD